jgi:antitoxin MazE
MKTTIQKWGNSLAIRIPKNITKETKVSEGSNINIITENGKKILNPTTKEYSLKELLMKITNENIHLEVSSGNYVGGEIW